MCDALLPALENEQFHRVIYAGLTHALKYPTFSVSSWRIFDECNVIHMNMNVNVIHIFVSVCGIYRHGVHECVRRRIGLCCSSSSVYCRCTCTWTAAGFNGQTQPTAS